VCSDNQEEIPAVYPQHPWYQNPRHWGWLAACVIAIVLGFAVLQQWQESIGLQLDYSRHRTSVGALTQRKQQLGNDLTVYQALLDQYGDQKEHLIREISQFDAELKVLSERVQGLERVRSRLDGLVSDFQRFQEAETQFKRNADALDRNMKARGKQTGGAE
jgi:hypothetical protein